MIPNIGHKKLDCLLKPLGICLAKRENSWELQTIDHHRAIGLHVIDYLMHVNWISLKSLKKDIFLVSNSFMIVGGHDNGKRFVENPYLGCRSLEELLVWLDLNAKDPV